jgi:hypothetical protein
VGLCAQCADQLRWTIMPVAVGLICQQRVGAQPQPQPELRTGATQEATGSCKRGSLHEGRCWLATSGWASRAPAHGLARRSRRSPLAGRSMWRAVTNRKNRRRCFCSVLHPFVRNRLFVLGSQIFPFGIPNSAPCAELAACSDRTKAQQRRERPGA